MAKTYHIRRVKIRNQKGPVGLDESIVEDTAFTGTIMQARKEVYRQSRMEDTNAVILRLDGEEVGRIAGVNSGGNENLWTVPDDRKPFGIRHMAIDKNGRVREIWGH